MPPEILVGAQDALCAQFVERFAHAAERAMAARGRFSCALTGGSVAQAVFPALALAPVDWSRVEFFWGDERAVPPTDPLSNYRLASELLLQHISADRARVHRMPADGTDLDAAAASYEAEMMSTLGNPPVIDLALLGMGPDGHVCSLFPGHPALSETSRSVVAVSDAPKPPPHRMTLTLRALGAARSIYLVAFGAEKASAIREAIEHEASVLPVSLAARSGPKVVFMLDPGAASLLTLPR